MNKTVGLDIAKWNLFFMKPTIELLWEECPVSDLPGMGFFTVNWPFCSRSWIIHTVLHPYSALSLMEKALNPAVPPPLHSNTILKMQVKDFKICLLTQVH